MDTSLVVQNLKCGGCAKTIMDKLSGIENISDLKVDVEKSAISFAFKRIKDVVLVKERLKSLGYPPIDEQNSLVNKAISFVSCATGKISKL